MKKARITYHPDYTAGEISRRLFGAFLEPIGSMVNGSMYDPQHPTADELGLRKDFYEALKDAGLPSVRLPGGNFVSGWRWKDSIGPREGRKTNLDMAWHQYIPNDVGHDEYLKWAERAGAEAMYTLNLGTGDLNEAVDLVEYTNFPGGTYWSDLRKKYGREDPYGVKIWYLGNEMDGPWQIASYDKDPRGYGILCHEVSKAIKFTDPRSQTAACVSSSPFLTHYPDWDRTVLEECYETVDYISLHHYHSALPGDIPALFAGVQAYENYIDTEIALCDYLRTKLRTRKTMMLSLDEYGSSFRPQADNVVYGMNGYMNTDSFYQFNPDQEYIRHDPHDWSKRRFPRRGNEMAMALANATTTLALVRRAGRVKIGCATGGLGMLAATDRDHVWKGASHYIMTDLIRLAKGTSLTPAVECGQYDVPTYALDNMNQYRGFEGVKTIQTAAAFNEETNELNVFVANTDAADPQELELDLSSFGSLTFKGHTVLKSDDPNAENTFETPDAIKPAAVNGTVYEGGKVKAKLDPISWNVFRFTK